jgi:triacylglycerol lipase
MSHCLQSPIVLAHGLLGFARIAVRGITLATYFRGIPRFLERLGNRVILANVPATGSIASRAQALRDEIRTHVAGEPVHVIAHSMGGLDCRYMITHLDMASQVLSLTTLSTPHRGTCLADVGIKLTERMGLFGWLRRSRFDHAAFEDLRTDTCARFNENTPDRSEVRYFSIAGVKPRAEMLYALRWGHDVIEPVEGPNDGLVSARSARWGEFLGEWNCDHLNMVGWTGPRERLAGYCVDVRPYYQSLVQRLAQVPPRPVQNK